jgi:hypothetical protein
MTPIRSLVLLAPLALGSCAWFRADPPEYDPVQLESGLVIRDEVVPESGPVVAPGDVVALRYELRVVGERTPVESSAARRCTTSWENVWEFRSTASGASTPRIAESRASRSASRTTRG